MSILVVTAFPAPEHRDEVVTAFEKAIIRIHDEPGVELYALHEGPDRLVVIEKYASEEARAQHGKGQPLADLLAALHGRLARPLDVQVLEPRPFGDPRKGVLVPDTTGAGGRGGSG